MSADLASSTAVGSWTTPAVAPPGKPDDPVRALQHALYRTAKADPGRRFHALHDKVWRRDVMWRAWVAVRRNIGAPGIDKTTLADVEEYGITRLLEELACDLREGRRRPGRTLVPRQPSTLPLRDQFSQRIGGRSLGQGPGGGRDHGVHPVSGGGHRGDLLRG